MKIISIIGARPQFIKAAMVSKAIRKEFAEILIHTGQHYDANMSAVFFDELQLPLPEIFLGVGSGSHAEQTGKMMIGIEQVLCAEKPDWTLVYGDTNSTLAGALASAKLNIPVAHVEAGLRSYNRAMPEEINRVLTDHISTALFCPNQPSVENLRTEGITTGTHVVGDVMEDALRHFLPVAQQTSQMHLQLGVEPGEYALATIHRAGNTDSQERLTAILTALSTLPIQIVLPIHPRTRKVLSDMDIHLGKNILLIEPVGYLDMLWLESNAGCILTDSGGIQKEAYSLGVRCITLRDETEWTETVENGWNCLVGADRASIVDTFTHWHPQSERLPIFGDGKAADKISRILAGANA